MNTETCPICGTPLIQKDKAQLVLTGIVFDIVGAVLIFLNWNLWPLSFFIGIISMYLIVWAIRGKGRWCRQCKSIPFK